MHKSRNPTWERRGVREVKEGPKNRGGETRSGLKPTTTREIEKDREKKIDIHSPGLS